MNKFLIIFSQTYLEKLKSKSFIITTVILMLLIIGAANFQTVADLFSSDDEGKDKIAVIDESGVLFEPLKQGVEAIDDDLELENYSGTEEDAKTAVEEEEYYALLVVGMDGENMPEATYYAYNLTDISTQHVLEEQLQNLKTAISIEQAGFDEQMIEEIYAPITFDAVALDTDAKSLEEMFQAQGIVYIMVFFMYMVVIIYGQMIAQDVANEKSSRVMEILISSAPPVTHMFAKIFGVAMVGLTQILALVLVGYFAITGKQDELAGGVLDTFGLVDIPVDLIICGIVFFLLGYLLYATLSAMLGSLVSRAEDVGQLLFPVITLLIIALFIAMHGLTSPESNIVTISSYIPFFTPMVMILRIGMLNLPVWEIALSIGIMIVTIGIFGIIGARVYRGGVLMYGKSASLKDFTKAISLSKKE